jgi:type II secretory pathway pseudopilin PulG
MKPPFSTLLSLRPARGVRGFSFVEAIFTIAIIGIMSSIVVVALSNASGDAFRTVARNQQTTLQSLLEAALMSKMRDTATGQRKSIQTVMAEYNALPHTKARYSLLLPQPGASNPQERVGFLDQTTIDHIEDWTYPLTDRVKTEALDALGQYLVFPDWTAGTTPTVEFRSN